MKITRIFYQGETAMITAKIYDSLTHELVDPAGATVSVYDPEKTLVIDSQPMVKDAIGEYHCDIDTAPFTAFGEYAAFIKATKDGRVSIEKTLFTVEALS